MHLCYPLDQNPQVMYPIDCAGAVIKKLYIAVKLMYTRWPISHLHNFIVKKCLCLFVQYFIPLPCCNSQRKLFNTQKAVCHLLFQDNSSMI